MRETSEADNKYSAVVSVPFPLSVLNLPFGSIILAAKSERMNVVLLIFYFIPVCIVCFCIFTVYQVAMLPFCYIKMAGHKWALMIKAPTGEGSLTTSDRAFWALMFTIFGPIVLLLSAIADSGWYLVHVCKTDLDKTEVAVAK